MRAEGNNNSGIFHKGETIPPAEQILRAIETAHDNWNLLEMNGERCAGRQISRLRWYDRARKSVTSDR